MPGDGSESKGHAGSQGQDGGSTRRTGNVKWFSVVKGFGFIRAEEGGDDLFVHQSNILSKGFRSLQEGEVVEFDLEAASDGRTKAVNVTGPGGGPIQSSTSRSSSHTQADLSSDTLPGPDADPDQVQTLSQDQRQHSVSGPPGSAGMGLCHAGSGSGHSISRSPSGSLGGSDVRYSGAGSASTGGVGVTTVTGVGPGLGAVPNQKSRPARKSGGFPAAGFGSGGVGAVRPPPPMPMAYSYPPMMPAPSPYYFGAAYYFTPPPPAYMDPRSQAAGRMRMDNSVGGAGQEGPMHSGPMHIGAGGPMPMPMLTPMGPGAMPGGMPPMGGMGGMGPPPGHMFYPGPMTSALGPGMAMGPMGPMGMVPPMSVAGVKGMSTVPGVESATPARSSGLQVVVHNLPWTCSWQQLKEHFRDFKPQRADIMMDPTGRSRGFGTVRFASQADAEEAIERLANSSIEDRVISVRMDRFA